MGALLLYHTIIDDRYGLIKLRKNTHSQYQTAWPINKPIDNLQRFRWMIEHYPIKSSIYQRDLKINIKMIQRRLGQIQMLSLQPPTWPIEKLLTSPSTLFETHTSRIEEGLYLLISSQTRY